MPLGPNNGNIDFSAMRILVELSKLELRWRGGARRSLPFPGGQRGEGESLMGSRALTHWTLVLIQSVRGPLAHHYQTLSLRLNRTVISCQSWKKLHHTHRLPVLLLCGWFCHNWSLSARIVLRTGVLRS